MPNRQVYPFVRFQYEDGSVDEESRTMLPIKVTNRATGISALVWGLVDTGADASLFPATLATSLGHDLNGDGVKSTVTSGIEQRPVATFKHTFCFELLSAKGTRTVWLTQSALIDCAESNPPVLLGVKDFLSHFKLTVDYPSERLALEW